MLELDQSTLRELAVRASCDPRTIEKALRGDPVRGLAGHRAREALRAAGYNVPAPKPQRRRGHAEGGQP